MSLFQEVRFRVKNTFVEMEEEDEEVQPPLLKCSTDSVALLRMRAVRADAAAADAPAQPHFSPGFAEATAAPVASAMKDEAQTQTATAAAVPQHPDVVALLVGSADLECRETSGKPASTPTQSPSAANKVSASWSKELWKNAPRNAGRDADAPSADAGSDSGLTTVMLRNLPNDYTRDMLLDLLDAHGFASSYDFVYLPTDFSRKAGLGYAFVNMISAAHAERVRKELEGFRRWSLPSSKVCSVGWSNPCQGLEANIKRYRDSPVMHPSVPDEFKPMLFVDGKRVQFPHPTRKLRRPEVGKAGRNPSKFGGA